MHQILKFFSYEHFYVIYCKFWELDQDHDFQLDKTDLAHYSNCALSYVIVDRIFEEVGCRLRPERETGSVGGWGSQDSPEAKELKGAGGAQRKCGLDWAGPWRSAGQVRRAESEGPSRRTVLMTAATAVLIRCAGAAQV